jgi:hypothetical protein
VSRRSTNANGVSQQVLKTWDEPVPNPWRTKAAGRRVLAAPIFLWCDDTSGNQSKRWNKHISFLFTFAGLPKSLASLAYNIHFLATFNIASPLEMLSKILEELR